MPTSRVLRLVALLAAVAAACGTDAQQPRPVTPRGPLLPDEQAVVRLFEASAPSVAYITTQALARRGLFFAEVAQGAGSGFVWDEKGHVVTNHHVIAGAQKVQVQLDAGRSYDARVVGSAPDYALAVVRLEQLPPGMKPIALGSSNDLRIGQTVFAIGNPFGMTRTLTRGIVSALDRQLPTSDIREIAGVIQINGVRTALELFADAGLPHPASMRGSRIAGLN